MSVKAATFASIITNPMNTHMFEVSIPEINYTAIIQSTSFPAQGRVRNIDLWHLGEKISYPGQPENGGEWNFTIPDSDDAKVKKEFDELAKRFYNQKTGDITTSDPWKSIIITCKDLQGKAVFSGILHGAWLRSRNNVTLDASRPDNALRWEYTFVYNWFEDGAIEG